MMDFIGRWGGKGLFFCMLFIGVLFQRWALNSDVWFILNSGRYVMANGIPHTEPFSIHEGLDFVLEQWLTDVIFWNIYDSFGVDGLLALTWMVGMVLIYAYYRLCILVSNKNKYVSFFILIQRMENFIVIINSMHSPAQHHSFSNQ